MNPLLLAMLKNRTLAAIFEPRPQTGGRSIMCGLMEVAVARDTGTGK